MQRFLLFVLAAILLGTSAKRLPDVYWNSSNTLFRVAAGGIAEMDVNIMDSLAIHCPLFDETIPYNDTEMFLIYRVSQLEYEHCIADEIARIVGRCSRPYIPQTIHTVFRHFTPLPSGLEYTPGNTYYFVSEPDLRLRGSQKEKHAHCSTIGPQMRIRVHRGTTEGVPHKMRHQSGVHHHSRPYPTSARHRHEAADGLSQPAGIGLNEMLMEDAPSEDEFSATQREERTHLRGTQSPSRRRGEPIDTEAKIHQEEPKLYEVHEIDDARSAHIRVPQQHDHSSFLMWPQWKVKSNSSRRTQRRSRLQRNRPRHHLEETRVERASSDYGRSLLFTDAVPTKIYEIN